ncbi:hypothetical protein ES705_05281 [subsurface metagenome]|nr:hypothetical protein [Clostridia bacterium]
MSTNIYFFFVDFLEPPSFTDRESFGFTTKWDESREETCGYTIVNFDDRERNPVIFTIAESAESAQEKLFRFVNKHGLKVMPVTLDWTKAQILVHDLNIIIRTLYYVTAKMGAVDEIDLAKLKEKVCRKIAQNRKWNRKFEELSKEIDKYKQKPSKELKVEILNRCCELNILPSKTK